MSYHVFFDFSTGIARAMTVPAGTVKSCQDHVRLVEASLGYERTWRTQDTPHWGHTAVPRDGVSDKVFCELAQRHNQWVIWFYNALIEWQKKKPTGAAERMKVRDAKTFWHGLTQIRVPPERWTESYYRDRMEHMYEVMRGRESEGVSFDEKPLTPRQAAQVINLFSFIDPGDARLDVPRGHDYLASSEDGGYVWCERAKCGAMAHDDADACRKRGCPIRAERVAAGHE